VIEANKLVVGSPARVLRDLTEQELAWKVTGTREYHDLVLRCKSTLNEVEPLAEMEPGRQRLSFGDHLLPKSQL